MGARTCIARLSGLSSNFFEEKMSDSTALSDGVTPSIYRSELSGMSAETFASTPTGSECDFYPEEIDTSNTAHVSASLCSSGRQLLLRIPVEACRETPDVKVI